LQLLLLQEGPMFVNQQFSYVGWSKTPNNRGFFIINNFYWW